jgi:hypothetical protein
MKVRSWETFLSFVWIGEESCVTYVHGPDEAACTMSIQELLKGVNITYIVT